MNDLLNADRPTVVKQYPRFEGSNICSWIGFKHIMYLAEEAVLQHFRDCGFVPRQLFEEYGLCFEIVASSIRILHAIHMDELVETEVIPIASNENPELVFSFKMFVEREKRLKTCTGRLKVLFRKHQDEIDASEIPAELLKSSVHEIDRSGSLVVPSVPQFSPGEGRGVYNPKDDLIYRIIPKDANAFVWKWHIPYIYCHFSKRMQMSGYIRLMEEVEDLFLADRGISIYTYLSTRQWIPVVSSSKIEMLREAIMEEVIYTVYTVEDIFRDATYTHRMDCYVERDGALIHTATGKITHGYARIENRKVWKLVNFDDTTLASLRRGDGES